MGLNRKLKKCLIISVVSIGIGLYITSKLFNQFADFRQSFANTYYDMPCTLPNINPFDESISKYFWVPDPLTCDNGVPDVVYVDDYNRIRFNESVLKELDIRKSDIKCSLENVVRNEDDKAIELVNIDINVDSDQELPGEFTHAHCETSNGKVLFDNVLSGIKDSKRKNGIGQKILDESDDNLSVYLFGLDSVSRAASFRYLPKTHDYLAKLGAYDFEGLMKVGDNTLPNIMALLTGDNTVSKQLFSKPFDSKPFIWKNFSSNGYATFYAEDCPHITAFNFMDGKGFHTPPTDHYMRPFWLYLNRDKMKYHFHNFNRILEEKGIQLQKQSVFCNQNTKTHVELINYFKKFLRHYRRNRKFTFTFLTELSHSHINFLHYGDEDFVNLFRWMKKERFLDNSVFIFFSDHGSRYNGLRNTYIGRMESRLPLLSILIPDHIKTKYPSLNSHMTQNTKRLITHYDIRQSMLDILSGNFQKTPSLKVNEVDRGISLFGEIPEKRSCADAGIPADYCACYKHTRIDVENNNQIHEISKAIVEHINGLLSQEDYCNRLKLDKVLSADTMSLGLEFRHSSWLDYIYPPEKNRVSYTVTIETVPGHATFEAVCEVDATGTFFVQPNIDRTNEYGNQTECVQNAAVKQFCFC